MSHPPSDTHPGPTSVRLNSAERQLFGQIASQLKTTRSRLLRKIVREAISQGPDFLDDDLATMNQASYQLGCVGRNLNQLLRLIYTGKQASTSDQQAVIEALRDRVEVVNEEMNRLIDRSYERWVIVESSNQ